MILGLSTFGFVHTALSVLALLLGLVVVWGLLTVRRLDAWTAVYLASALAATATGFGFPGRFGVPHYIGMAALVFLAVTALARYAFHLHEVWRPIYAFAAVLSVWSLAFFAVGEAFLRV